MIISHKYKFIFLHGRKCAGSSMEVVLNKYLGPDDIQIGSWEETLCGGGNMNRKAIIDTFFYPLTWIDISKNLLSIKFLKKKIDLAKIINWQIKKRYHGSLGENPACATAELVKSFDPTAWRDYFKFAFVRNPIDFEISDYFWRTKKKKNLITFKEFLKKKLKITTDEDRIVPYPSTNWPIYSINNKIALDYIGKFENLSNEVSLIGKYINIPLNIFEFPIVKKGVKKNYDLKNLCDNECLEMIQALHKHEFNFFDYDFSF